MAEPENHRLRSIGAGAAGIGEARLRVAMHDSKRRHDASRCELDDEGWLIGWLTLACLQPRPGSQDP